jgi:hypothetical protein
MQQTAQEMNGATDHARGLLDQQLSRSISSSGQQSSPHRFQRKDRVRLMHELCRKKSYAATRLRDWLRHYVRDLRFLGPLIFGSMNHQDWTLELVWFGFFFTTIGLVWLVARFLWEWAMIIAVALRPLAVMLTESMVSTKKKELCYGAYVYRLHCFTCTYKRIYIIPCPKIEKKMSNQFKDKNHPVWLKSVPFPAPPI